MNIGDSWMDDRDGARAGRRAAVLDRSHRPAPVPDVPTRLHAATKPQVLGLVLICIAIGLSLREWPAIAFLVPIIMIQLATAPLAAHMVGRQAYSCNGTIDERSLYVDELAEAQRTPPAAGG